jgi:hypothetical protein
MLDAALGDWRVVMTSWPGWNSIDSASAWAHFWFWFGIGCFFLLGASEIIAFRYGLRKDALIEIRDQQRDQDQQTAEARHRDEVATLRTQLETTSKQLETKQLETTSAQVAADNSLGKRVRDLFASIDPNILRQIDSGHFDLTIRMQPSDIEQLQKLREKPGGGDLVSIISFGRRWTHSTISNGTLGPSTPVPRQTEVTIRVSKALSASK